MAIPGSMIDELRKSDPKNYAANLQKLQQYENYLNSNFGNAEAERMLKSGYFVDAALGGTDAVLSKAAGTSDPNVLAELKTKLSASGKNAIDFATDVAANKDFYLPKQAEERMLETAKKTADTLAGTEIDQLKSDLGEKEKESRSYIDRVLASRGLTSSGSVGAQNIDLAGQYAKALASGVSGIRTNALNRALNREYQLYDTNIAQTYADKINKQYMDAVKQGQQANQPTFWDYASNIIGGLTGISQIGGKSGLGLWGK